MNSFFISDAATFGLHEAVVLQKFTWWINENRRRDRHATHFHKDRWWMYTSVREMKEKSFPFFSDKTLRTVIDNLVKAGILLKGHFNPDKKDRSVWYSVTQPVGWLSEIATKENSLHHFYPEDVKPYGLNAAVMLWFFRMVCDENKLAVRQEFFYEGKYWLVDSYASLARTHPYFTERQIRLANEILIKAGVLKAFQKDGKSGCKWYTVMGVVKSANGGVTKLTNGLPEPANGVCHDRQMGVTQPANGVVTQPANGGDATGKSFITIVSEEAIESKKEEQCIVGTNIVKNNVDEIFEKKFENSTTEGQKVEEKTATAGVEEKEKIFAAGAAKNPPEKEAEYVEILDDDKPPFLPQDMERAQRLGEMFYRVMPELKGKELHYEINKFLNKYPYVPTNKCGALVSDWAMRLQTNPRPRPDTKNQQYGTNGTKPTYKSTWQKQSDIVNSLYAEVDEYFKKTNSNGGDGCAGEVFSPDV